MEEHLPNWLAATKAFRYKKSTGDHAMPWTSGQVEERHVSKKYWSAPAFVFPSRCSPAKFSGAVSSMGLAFRSGGFHSLQQILPSSCLLERVRSVI